MQALTQAQAGACQAGLDRSERLLNCGGNFGVIEALDVGQNDHHPEVGGKILKTMLNGMFEFSLVKLFFRGGVGIGQPARGLDFVAVFGLGLERRGGTASFTAQFVVAGVGDSA